MTIAATTVLAGPYTGSGTTGPFSFSFRIQDYGDVTDDSQVEVTKVTIATGAESILTLTTDYTVSPNADQDASPGGSVTLVSALTSSYKLYIRRSPSFLQSTNLTNQGAYYAETIETQLDQLTMQIQALKDQMRRAPVAGLQSGSSFSGAMTGAPTAGQVPVVNSDASGFELGNPVEAAVSDAMLPVVLSATLALGRTAFGLGTGDTPTLTGLALSATATGSLLNLTSTAAHDGNSGPNMDLRRSATPSSAGNALSRWRFMSRNDAASEVIYGQLAVNTVAITAAGYTGSLVFGVASAASVVDTLTLRGAQVASLAGSAAAPAYVSGGDLDTGMYFNGANAIFWSVGGAAVWGISNAGVLTGQAGCNVWTGDGSAAAPASAYTADNDSGVYRIGADQVGISLGGVKAVDFHGTRTQFAAAIELKGYTVATLPAGATARVVFCTDLRVFNGTGTQEGAGVGTGGIVSYNGTAWKIAGTNVTAVA